MRPGGNWWDKLGKPQYGGEMVIRANMNIKNFDPYFDKGLTSIYGGGWKDWSLMIGHWIRQSGTIKHGLAPLPVYERPTGGKLGVY